ncbi:lysophospholipid acyltransferase family protein [Phytoactinopolyspora limicola]|uniref:lysophospholipid acyltransferase family protein n=1 Tax=Phytoactinopolyspora limicola TaxID=2715536 RepID=UPI001A9CA47F|nr:lysophospholipid acyltransferase family protein [Phytoactinopolyspora limicola]
MAVGDSYAAQAGRAEHPEYWHDVPGPPGDGTRLLRPVAVGVVRGAWRVRVHGHHNIPARGPVILASNHTNIVDGPLLYGVVRRPVHALVKQEMFAGVLGPVLRYIGQIPVDRFAPDPAAVKDCLAVLHRGGVVAIYPEGTRGTGWFEQTKPGAAYLALCTGAPIVPVVCIGAGARGSTGRLPRLRSTIDVVFGAPIETTAVRWPRRRTVVGERADDLATRLREHVRWACELTGRDPAGRPLAGREFTRPTAPRPGDDNVNRAQAG